MGEPFQGRPFPNAVGYAAVGMVLVIVAMTAVVSAERRAARAENPLASYDSEVLRDVDIRFETRPDGAVSAFHVGTGRELAVFSEGTDSFTFGVLKSLTRLRRAEGLAPVTPMRLTAWADGRLSLHDPQTQGLVELSSFGSHRDAFVKLMEAAGVVRRRGDGAATPWQTRSRSDEDEGDGHVAKAQF